MEATREIFWSLSSREIAVFYGLATLSVVIFTAGVLKHLAPYRHGRPNPSQIDWLGGIRRMVIDLFTHRQISRRDRTAGRAHAAIFFGFLVLLLGTTIIFIDYDIIQRAIGRSFWKGTFYLFFSAAMDIAGLALMAGVAVMIVRRFVLRPAKLAYKRHYRGEVSERPSGRKWRFEDKLLLAWLIVIVLTGFLQEGLRLAMDRPQAADWSPIGAAVAIVLETFGLDREALHRLRTTNWWFHGIICLGFVAAIPWYKAKHMIAAMVSLVVRDPVALRRLPPPKVIAENEEQPYTLNSLPWKAMLQFDACTKCGRCHAACPATATGAPLSPRDLILDLRNFQERATWAEQSMTPIVPEVIEAETIWSCRTCGACQEICPVGIEQPPLIVELRRSLVEAGEMPRQLQTAFDTISTFGNSFGMAPTSRGTWTRELSFPIKDLRVEAAEWLWFVGDYASFDPRNQRISKLYARLLRAARVDFGILYDAERNAGNDVRRAGEEGLFDILARRNLEALQAANPFHRIMTTDPHSLNTIRNEYTAIGEVAPVEHYTSILADLLESGQLKVRKPLSLNVTLHDPCHLGRLNGEYEAPRRVLRAIGCTLVEMPRSRDNSFCCGAGGGRIWLPDPPDKERPSENRMREAVALPDVTVFVTCCPKDLVMFEDARKTIGSEKDIIVRDVVELIAEAIELERLERNDLPVLIAGIADRLLDRIGGMVDERIRTALDATPPLALGGGQAPTTWLEADNGNPPGAVPGGSACSEAKVEDQHGEPLNEQKVEAKTTGKPTFNIEESPMRRDWSIAPFRSLSVSGYEVPPKTGLRILVPVKAVALIADETTLAAKRADISTEDVTYAFNDWDDVALEEALRLVEAHGVGEVVIVTIGPEEAEEVMLKALAKGATRGVRVWSHELDGADPLTIARTLAGVAEREQPDLILAGAQSADFGHGATGIALARLLDIPHAAVVVAVEQVASDRLRVTRELEGGLLHVQELPSPAVVSLQTGANQPRYATLRMVKQARVKPIVRLDLDPVAVGFLRGGVVRRRFVPERARADMLQGSIDDIAAQVAAIIRDQRRTG